MQLRRFKPNPGRLRVTGLVLLSIGLVFLILSTVFPFPEGTGNFLSIGMGQKASANPSFTARTETYVDVSSLSDPFDFTVTKPTGTIDGDILFCWLGWYATVTVDSVPAGWTLLAEYLDNTDRYAVYWKVASSEGASWDWSLTGTTKLYVVCSCYTGGDFDAGDPIDVVSNTAYRTFDTSCIAAAMSVTAANSPLVFWASTYSAVARTFAKPTTPSDTWVEDDDAGSGTSRFWTEVCSMIWSGSGDTTAMTATISASATLKHAFAVALNPAAGVVAPTVTTQAATNINCCNFTANGTITDTGGENCHTRGVCYYEGTSGDPTTANSTVYDNGGGSYGTGAYAKVIAGLSCNTTYRVRAYAINSAGTGYGTTVSVTTSDWLSGWAYRSSIAIDADDIDSDLTWFPVMLHLGTSAGIGADDVSFIFDELGNAYQKIAVTEDDGTTQLYVEVESWNSTAEEAVLWVSREDWVASSSTDSILYFYYDSTHGDNVDYVFGTADISSTTPAKEINTATYDAMGCLVKTGDDAVHYFYRVGASHVGAGDYGKVYKCLYTPSTDSWGTPASIYDASGSGYDSRNIGGGIIGSNVYVFFARYSPDGTPAWIDIGYIKSTDLTCTSWGSYTTISVGGSLTAFSPHGHIAETSVSGTYLQPYYGQVGATYQVRLFKTTDSGDNWADAGVTIYSGATKYTEVCIDYIGSSKLIALIRDNDTGYLGQSMSEDDGASWGTDVDHDDGVVDVTNLGAAVPNPVPWLYYDSISGNCLGVAACRGSTDKLRISETDAATVFADATAWVTPTDFSAGSLFIGYGSIAKLSGARYLYVYAEEQVSETDADTWDGYYASTEHRVWDSDYLAVYHMTDGADTSHLYDSSGNSNTGTKQGANEPQETASGKLGNAQDFDGTDDKVSVLDTTLLSAITPITVTAWMKTTETGVGGIISKDGGASGNREWVLSHSNGTISLNLYSSASANFLTGATNVVNCTDGSWHHVVATWDGVNDAGHINIWIDGVDRVLSVDSKVGSGCVPYDGTKPVEIGRYYADNAGCFDGIIDEARIAEAVSSDAWIKASYEGERDNLVDWEGQVGMTITNGPGSNDFGVLEVNTTGNTAINYFQIENIGSCLLDVAIYGTDASGGIDDIWDLDDTGTPGENIYALYAGLDDDDDTFDTIVKEIGSTPYNILVTNLGAYATQDWGLKIYMPTSVSGYDGQQMTATITLVASQST